MLGSSRHPLSLLACCLLIAVWIAPALDVPARAAAAPGDAGNAPAPWDATGSLTALAWPQPDASLLQPYQKEGRLLFSNQDLALLLLPEGLAAAVPSALLETLEPAAPAGGDYYVVLVADAEIAQFSGDVRVLFRKGHSVVLWASGTPQLTPESRALLPGLVQPVRVTFAPKAWPVTSVEKTLVPPAPTRTEFDPIVDQIVADVSQTEYVEVWQALDDFETRYFNTAANEASANYMYNYFLSLGLEAEFHLYVQSGGTRKNVVGILPGLVDPERVVYITGHFDSTSEDPQNHAPGADDNASGSAAFLEAARVLSQYAFHYTIKFVGFNGEEQGLLGSDAYVDMIAAEGEDVVACYNFDMIAYRGTDPAPADLIIYTNSASLDKAEILRDAYLEYFPADVQPIIVQESISGSDHYSFWQHGYEAVLGIEDEAWGSDFCPWYHTSNDRIERYPQDYPTHCTAGGIAAAAHTAIPLAPAAPFLVLDAETWDDDASGASQGNGNGVLEFGETIELTLALRNVGQAGAVNVTGTLLCDDEYVTVTAATASFLSIPPQGTGTNTTPFVFAIDAAVPDGRALAFRLAVSEAPDTLNLNQTARAPALAVVGVLVDDTAGGDGDGTPEPGESLVLTVPVANSGGAGITDVWGTLVQASPYLTVDPTPQSYGALLPSGQASAAFAAAVDPLCPEVFPGLLRLDLEAAGGYTTSLPVALYIGDVFADDMEYGVGGWTHYAGGTGYGDQWHLETYRNHTYGGDTSWKCGGAGSVSYANSLYAVLESAAFTLPAEAHITFWHWISAEVSSSYTGYAYDGGVAEISIDGGPWQRLTPEGGYPYRIRQNGTPGLPAETPVWSGSHGWQEETLDLASYQGSARLRFIFCSDTGVTQEGWYIDDLQLHFTASGFEPIVIEEGLRLHPARPNPTAGETRLLLDLPAALPVDVRVYDPAGRCVSAIHEGELPAGSHAIAWDGCDAAGRPAGAGIYWIRVRAGAEEKRVRVLMVR